MIITSLENKIVKETIKLKQKKFRDEEGKFIVEGIKMVSEIPNVFVVDYIIVSENYKGSQEKLDNDKFMVVSDNVFRKLTDTEEPQGIMAVCNKIKYDMDEILKRENLTLFLLEELQDPGNLGTIIRTADATNIDAIIISKNSVDLYNPKTIRATMASIFHLPIIVDMDLDILYEQLNKNKIKIMATSLNTNTYLYDIKFADKKCIVIGNEAKGISKYTSEKSDILFKIPMLGKAESLNAGIASSVIMYEIVRQKLQAHR